jgi:hypothetical protein
MCEKAKGFKENIKLLMHNKRTHSISVNQIVGVYFLSNFLFLKQKFWFAFGLVLSWVINRQIV